MLDVHGSNRARQFAKKLIGHSLYEAFPIFPYFKLRFKEADDRRGDLIVGLDNVFLYINMRGIYVISYMVDGCSEFHGENYR